MQHIALKTNDIFETVSKIRYAGEELGGFELMKRPGVEYYEDLFERLGNRLNVSFLSISSKEVHPMPPSPFEISAFPI